MDKVGTADLHLPNRQHLVGNEEGKEKEEVVPSINETEKVNEEGENKQSEGKLQRQSSSNSNKVAPEPSPDKKDEETEKERSSWLLVRLWQTYNHNMLLSLFL